MKIYPPSTIRKTCLGYSNNPKLQNHSVPTGKIGAIKGAFQKLLAQKYKGHEDEYRHIICGYLLLSDNLPFRPLASVDMTPPQWIGLGNWIGWPDRRPAFESEFWWVLTKALSIARIAQSHPEMLMSELVSDVTITIESDDTDSMIRTGLELGGDPVEKEIQETQEKDDLEKVWW